MTASALGRMLLRRRRLHALGVLVLHVAATGLALAGPPLVGAGVDRVTAGRDVLDVVLTFVAVTVAAACLSGVAARASASFTEGALAELRDLVVQTVTGRPAAAVEEARTGDLLGRATADVEAISVALRTGMPRLVIAVLTVLLTAVALTAVSPLLAAAALAGVVVATPAVWWYLRRCGAVYAEERHSNAARIRTFHEGAAAAELVRAYGQDGEQLAAQRRADGAWFRAAMAGARIRVVARGGVAAGIAVALGSVVAVGAFGTTAGAMTVGTVTAAVLYLLRTVEPIEMLVHELDELQTARAAASRVAGAVDARDSGAAGLQQPGPVPRHNGVQARDVWFAYPNGREVLHGIDLDIEPGAKIALVGPSGAGKSTLARILAGVHPPDRGQVLLGGVDLRLLDPITLRRWVIVLEQECYVFAGTLADNLRLVAPDATRDDLLDALLSVGATWVRDLAGGLDRDVGAGGWAMPVTQARQLALARVVLADPPVVILDEATAGFDAGAAATARTGLDTALAGRTVVLVSHRLDAARRADRVVVVADGCVAETGTHEELVSPGGRYAELWQAWAAPA